MSSLPAYTYTYSHATHPAARSLSPPFTNASHMLSTSYSTPFFPAQRIKLNRPGAVPEESDLRAEGPRHHLSPHSPTPTPVYATQLHAQHAALKDAEEMYDYAYEPGSVGGADGGDAVRAQWNPDRSYSYDSSVCAHPEPGLLTPDLPFQPVPTPMTTTTGGGGGVAYPGPLNACIKVERPEHEVGIEHDVERHPFAYTLPESPLEPGLGSSPEMARDVDSYSYDAAGPPVSTGRKTAFLYGPDLPWSASSEDARGEYTWTYTYFPRPTAPTPHAHEPSSVDTCPQVAFVSVPIRATIPSEYGAPFAGGRAQAYQASTTSPFGSRTSAHTHPYAYAYAYAHRPHSGTQQPQPPRTASQWTGAPASAWFEDPEQEFKSKGKRHTCSVCNKRFNRPSSLSTHMNTHTGAKPYMCSHPLCGRLFSVKSNLKRHVRQLHSPHAWSLPPQPAERAPSPDLADSAERLSLSLKREDQAPAQPNTDAGARAQPVLDSPSDVVVRRKRSEPIQVRPPLAPAGALGYPLIGSWDAQDDGWEMDSNRSLSFSPFTEEGETLPLPWMYEDLHIDRRRRQSFAGPRSTAVV